MSLPPILTGEDPCCILKVNPQQMQENKHLFRFCADLQAAKGTDFQKTGGCAPLTREKQAAELFDKGYNCAQAAAGAFVDVAGVDFDTLMRLTAPLGGGVGRCGELCGAVNGMAIAHGLINGRFHHEDSEEKARFAADTAELVRSFAEEAGALRCEDLLRLREKTAEKHIYCCNLVRTAARILEKRLTK